MPGSATVADRSGVETRRSPGRDEEESAWAAYWAERSVEHRNVLVEMYRPVALAVARRSLDYALSVGSAMSNLDDLGGIAQEALIGAVERFDPTKGASFAYYAKLRIAGHVRDALRADDYLSRRTRQKVRALREGRLDELSESQEREARRVASQVPSTDEPDDPTSAASATDQVESKVLASLGVEEALRSLRPAERLVVEYKYMRGMSLSAIGAVLSVTESRACQIHLEALRRLRASA